MYVGTNELLRKQNDLKTATRHLFTSQSLGELDGALDLPNQATLYGLLSQLRNQGLTLISVQRVCPGKDRGNFRETFVEE